MQIKATEIRNGTKIEMNGDLFMVVDFMHITPGKGRAVVRSKLKSITTGRVIDKTFSSQEKIDLADLETRKMQYLYREENDLMFMDMNSYEQIIIGTDITDDAVRFIKENQQLDVLFSKGAPIGIDLPIKVTLKVTETTPGERGDTVSAATKPATLETGLTVQVPLFINEGDQVVIDTRDGKYEERA